MAELSRAGGIDASSFYYCGHDLRGHADAGSCQAVRGSPALEGGSLRKRERRLLPERRQVVDVQHASVPGMFGRQGYQGLRLQEEVELAERITMR